MKHPVLVGVGKLAEHPEPMVRELVPSVVRLQTLDDCLRGWCDAPDLIHAFVQEVVSVFEDGELRIFSDALGQRVAPTGFGKVIDEVVEGGPHVVQTLPDDKSEFGGRVFKDFNLYELVSSLRIEFCVNTVRAWFEPPTAFAFEALQVARGPFQPKFAVIHVVESPLVSLGP
jgi:hypothetical protein